MQSVKASPSNHKVYKVQSVLDGRGHNQQSPVRDRSIYSKKKSPVKKQAPGITPKLSSTKFAAVEMLQKKSLMRPTSSRVGYFMPEKHNIDNAHDYNPAGYNVPKLARPLGIDSSA